VRVVQRCDGDAGTIRHEVRSFLSELRSKGLVED
jgi:hypothetical protein